MEPLRIGVIGCADIARRRMLPAMAASPDAEVTAVASRDGERAREVAGAYGCRAVRGYAELLGLDEVQAVYVPLPAALHADWVEAALRAGKHVLAEKPLTTDPARTAALVSLARERGLALMENVMFVHHSQHAAVRAVIADGAIGEPRFFHASFAIPRRPDGDIRYRAALGGGALWDVGVYPVRAAMHLLGGDGPNGGLDVAGAVLTRGPGREVATSGAALLRTADGVGAQLAFGLDHAYRSEYSVWGSLGRITVERAFTPPADHRPVLRLERSAGTVTGTSAGGASGTREIRLEPDDQVANTVTAFVAAVRVHDTPGESLRQAELLDRILRMGTIEMNDEQEEHRR